MKNKLLILALLFMLPAYGEDVILERMLDKDQVNNSGYSDDMYYIMSRSNARANSKKYVKEKNEPEYYNTQPTKFVRNLFMYFDMAYDRDTFLNHDISPNTRWDDL